MLLNGSFIKNVERIDYGIDTVGSDMFGEQFTDTAFVLCPIDSVGVATTDILAQKFEATEVSLPSVQSFAWSRFNEFA